MALRIRNPLHHHDPHVATVGFNLLGDVVLTPPILEQILTSERKTILDDIATLLPFSSGPTLFNFEGTIGSSGERRRSILPDLFAFRSPPKLLPVLKQTWGRIVLCFANNHIADFGETGMEETVRAASSAEVPFSGIGRAHEAYRPAFFAIEHLRGALCSFTNLLPPDCVAKEGHYGAAFFTKENVKRVVEYARSKADVVVVSLHVAASFKEPFHFAPDSVQEWMARFAIDCGADVVFGHQPHGIQRIDWYKGKPILHSLGPAIFDPQLSEYQPPPESRLRKEAFPAYGGGVASVHFCQEGLCYLTVREVMSVLRKYEVRVVSRSSFRQWMLYAKLLRFLR